MCPPKVEIDGDWWGNPRQKTKKMGEIYGKGGGVGGQRLLVSVEEQILWSVAVEKSEDGG